MITMNLKFTRRESALGDDQTAAHPSQTKGIPNLSAASRQRR